MSDGDDGAPLSKDSLAQLLYSRSPSQQQQTTTTEAETGKPRDERGRFAKGNGHDPSGAAEGEDPGQEDADDDPVDEGAEGGAGDDPGDDAGDQGDDEGDQSDGGEDQPVTGDTIRIIGEDGKPKTVAVEELLKGREFQLPGDSGETVTLEQALDGYMLKADYSRKTMALAAERQGIATERQTILDTARTEGAEHIASLKRNVAAVEELYGVEPDWTAEIARGVPSDTVIKRKLAWEAKEKRIADTKATIAAHEAEDAKRADETAKATAEATLKTHREYLLDQYPEWKQKARADRDLSFIGDYFERELGFEDGQETILALLQIDPRLVMIARGAAARAKSEKTREKVTTEKRGAKQPAPRVQPAGSTAQPRTASRPASQALSEANRRVEQTGSVTDMANLLLTRRQEAARNSRTPGRG